MFATCKAGLLTWTAWLGTRAQCLGCHTPSSICDAHSCAAARTWHRSQTPWNRTAGECTDIARVYGWYKQLLIVQQLGTVPNLCL